MRLETRGRDSPELASEETPSVEKKIQVAWPGDLSPGDPPDSGETPEHVLGQLPRIGLQELGQLEGEGHAQVAEFGPGRVVNVDIRLAQRILSAEPGDQLSSQPFLEL